MIITRRNPFTSEMISREIDVTQHEYDNWLNGQLIQDAMPHLSADEREFIMTGITPEQWDKLFGVDDEEPLDDPDLWIDWPTEYEDFDLTDDYDEDERDAA